MSPICTTAKRHRWRNAGGWPAKRWLRVQAAVIEAGDQPGTTEDIFWSVEEVGTTAADSSAAGHQCTQQSLPRDTGLTEEQRCHRAASSGGRGGSLRGAP